MLLRIGHQAVDVQIGQGRSIAANEGRPDKAQLGRAHLHEAQRIGVPQTQGAAFGDGDFHLAARALFHIRRKRADLHRLWPRGGVAVVEFPFGLSVRAAEQAKGQGEQRERAFDGWA